MRPVGGRQVLGLGMEGHPRTPVPRLGVGVFRVSLVTGADPQRSWQAFPQIDFCFSPPTNEQLHIPEEVRSAGQLLKPSVQNELQRWRTPRLTSPSSETVFRGYITALTAWLRGTFLPHRAHRQPCCMHQWLRLPTGLLFLWRRMQGCMNTR